VLWLLGGNRRESEVIHGFNSLPQLEEQAANESAERRTAGMLILQWYQHLTNYIDHTSFFSDLEGVLVLVPRTIPLPPNVREFPGGELLRIECEVRLRLG
jgi:hypothetical protein